MDIGEVASRSGVTPSALRYYEEIGLIQSFGRSGLRRQFDANVLMKLDLIALGKQAGFSLTEIARMFSEDGRLNIPRPELRSRANELQRQIVDLRVLRDALRHVADCPAPSHLECPTFQKLIKSASKQKPNRQNFEEKKKGRSQSQF